MRTLKPTSYEVALEENIDIYHQLFVAMAGLTELMSDFLDATLPGSTASADCEVFLSRAQYQRNALLDAHRKWSSLYEQDEYTWPPLAVRVPWTPQPYQRSFASYQIAKIECIYWTGMIITNRLIIHQHLYDCPLLQKENYEFAEAICQSYSFARKDAPLEGTWIADCLPFALFELGSDATKARWISTAIHEVSASMKFAYVGQRTEAHDHRLRQFLRAAYPGLAYV
jgi:hypothetical protein